MSPDSPEFENLLAAVCHNTASDEQLSQLATILAGNEEAQTVYLRYVDLHATLASDDALFAGDDLEMDGVSGSNAAGIRLPGGFDASSPERRDLANSAATKGARILLFTVIAALIAGGLLLLSLFNATPDKVPSQTPEPTSTFALASVTRSHQAVWEGVAPPDDIAEPLPLLLQSGLVQIEFNSGAIILAEAPLEGEILSASAVRIDHGKIRVIVPSQSSEFTIYTDSVKVTGSNCEFGVALNGVDKGEVHSFGGTIEFIPSGKTPKRTLDSGEAVMFLTDTNSSLRPSSRPATPSDFVDLRELDEQARSAGEFQHNQWMKHLLKTQTDETLLVHYTFENFNPWDRIVRNTASALGAKTNGAMVGCKWTRGRWPEKGAVEFHRPSHRIRLNIRKEAAVFTFIAWINIPETPNSFQAIFSSSDTSKAGVISPEWALGKDGALFLTLRKHGDVKPILVRSKPLISAQKTGRWIQLALTCSNGSANFYLDGELIQKKELPSGYDGPFYFGRSDLGNRSLPVAIKSKDKERAFGKNKKQKQPKERNRISAAPFIGLIDEFQIFTRALSAEEIRADWEAGNPVPLP